MINYENLIKESISNDRNDKVVLPGIHNRGWNCYINSALQVLASDIVLVENLTKNSDEDQEFIDLILKYKLQLSGTADLNDKAKEKIKKMVDTGLDENNNSLNERD